MVLRSDLTDWEFGNFSNLDKDSLFKIATYFETAANKGFMEADELIIEDMKEDEEDLEEEDLEEEDEDEEDLED